MVSTPGHSRPELLQALETHPHASELCTRTSQIVLAAAAAGRPEWLSTHEVAELDGNALFLERAQAQTPFGNPLEILDRGARSWEEWQLLAAAVALYVGRTWRELPLDTTIAQLAWLAEHTPCNPWLWLDHCLDEEATEFWELARAQLLGKSARAQLPVLVALMGSSSPGVLALWHALLEQSPDPTVRSLLARGLRSEPLVGELVSAPPHTLSLLVQAFTGWLLLRALWRTVGRHVFGARRPAELRLNGPNLELSWRRRLLGRELRTRTSVIPLHQVAELTRETRFSGVGLYAGLAALALGTSVGTGLFVDAFRVPGGSPSLLGLGLGIVLAGLVLDFALSSLDRLRGTRTRLLVVPRSGKPWALATPAAEAADHWLRQLRGAADDSGRGP